MCFTKSKSSDQLSKVYPEKGGVVGRRGAGGRERGGRRLGSRYEVSHFSLIAAG